MFLFLLYTLKEGFSLSFSFWTVLKDNKQYIVVLVIEIVNLSLKHVIYPHFSIPIQIEELIHFCIILNFYLNF